MRRTPEYVSLIVKGSKKHAKREAARQGVPVASCVEKGAETQCFVKCTPTTRDRLATWFVADRGKRGSRSRRPPGTLLYHSSAVKCERGYPALSGPKRRKRSR